MAELVTIVRSPLGVVSTLPGRVERSVAKQTVAAQLRSQIREMQAHLAEVDSWSTEARRGSLPALTFEQLEAKNGNSILP